MRKNVIKILKFIFVIGLIIGLLFFGIEGYKELKSILPSFQKEDITELMPGIDEDYTYVIFEDKLMELTHYPKIVDEKIYLPIDFVIGYLNPNFYWDEAEKTLTYTTNNDVIRMKTDDITYFVNDEPLNLNFPILELEDNMAYIPSDLLNKFSQYELTYNKELDLLMIDDSTKDATYGNISVKETYLRVEENDKSHYIIKLQKSDRVKIYDESESWYYVRTKDGYLGYVKKKDMSDTFIILGNPIKEEVNNYNTKKNINGKINFVWNQVFNVNANSNVYDHLKDVNGLDVLSPTWFSIKDSDGNISNIADLDYVDWAHKNGYQVWALIDNGFSASISHDVLGSTSKREKLIKQILAFAAVYNLDGINIDFESVAKEDGPAYVQFIRELSPYLKNQGIIVSVDMYVPSDWTKHYNREEVSKVVDYVIVMAYDEHWAGDSESGSVASIDFVNNAIVNTLKDVPKEKLILGLPYYTRLWQEQVQDGQTVVTSTAYSMEGALNVLSQNNADIIWDDSVKQYYCQYMIGDITYRIWLEDERSIEEKTKLITEYDLAGAAGWKLGLEKKEVWEVLYKYLKK